MGHPLLTKVAHTKPSSTKYAEVQTSVQSGLIKFAMSDTAAINHAILHFQKFTKAGRTKRRAADDDFITKRIPSKYLSELNVKAYNILREHALCTCSNAADQETHRVHLSKLLLRPPPRDASYQSQVEFDMLFSSSPSWSKPKSVSWRHVQLIVPMYVSKAEGNSGEGG